MENADILSYFSQVVFSTRIFLLCIVLFLGMVGMRSVSKRLVSIALKTARKNSSRIPEKKVETLAGLVSNIGHVVLWLIVGMMLLGAFGIDIRPILAGAGVLGFAVGFGAQSLIKDLISGVLILLEDQFSVGDYVKIGNFEGKILMLTVRSTVIEDKEGARIYLQNGSISSVVNYSQNKKKDSFQTKQ